jgi:hypothetical protein
VAARRRNEMPCDRCSSGTRQLLFSDRTNVDKMQGKAIAPEPSGVPDGAACYARSQPIFLLAAGKQPDRKRVSSAGRPQRRL